MQACSDVRQCLGLWLPTVLQVGYSADERERAVLVADLLM